MVGVISERLASERQPPPVGSNENGPLIPVAAPPPAPDVDFLRAVNPDTMA